MKKQYFIETVRSAFANGGMTCSGWHPGPATAEIKVKADDGEQFYLSAFGNHDGVCVFKTEKSTFDNQIEEVSDDSFWDYLDENMIASGDSFDQILLNNFGISYLFLYEYLSVVVEHPLDGEVVQVNQYVDDILENSANPS